MGTLKNGMHEGFSGKAGGLIGYYLNGQWVVRGLPKRRNKRKPLTEKEINSRLRFRIAQLFLRPIVDFVRIGFQVEASKQKMTGHNLAKSKLMREAMDAKNNINYQQFKISMGSLEPAHQPSIKLEGNHIMVNWKCPSSLSRERNFDQALLLAYDVKRGFPLGSIAEISRSDENGRIELGSPRAGKTYQVWLGFVSLDRKEAADSVYLGEIEYT